MNKRKNGNSDGFFGWAWCIAYHAADIDGAAREASEDDLWHKRRRHCSPPLLLLSFPTRRVANISHSVFFRGNLSHRSAASRWRGPAGTGRIFFARREQRKEETPLERSYSYSTIQLPLRYLSVWPAGRPPAAVRLPRTSCRNARPIHDSVQIGDAKLRRYRERERDRQRSKTN